MKLAIVNGNGLEQFALGKAGDDWKSGFLRFPKTLYWPFIRILLTLCTPSCAKGQL